MGGYVRHFYPKAVHTSYDVRGLWPKNVKDDQGRSLSPSRVSPLLLRYVLKTYLYL